MRQDNEIQARKIEELRKQMEEQKLYIRLVGVLDLAETLKGKGITGSDREKDQRIKRGVVLDFIRKYFDAIKEAVVGYDTYANEEGERGQLEAEKLTYEEFIADDVRCRAYMGLALLYLNAKQSDFITME